MRSSEQPDSSSFDLYLLSLSWAPSFCCQKDKRKQCSEQGLRGAERLTVHGLWPSYKYPRGDGKTYPSNCATVVDDLAQSLKGIERHEWIKHGTCSGLGVNSYRAEAAKSASLPVVLAMERLLSSRAGTYIEVSTLLEIAGKQTPNNATPAVSASPLCQLKELTLCLSKRLDGTVGELIPCPDHVLRGGRNSAATHKCAAVVVDSGASCQFITKALSTALRGNK